MHITKIEEKALGIKEDIKVAWREEHNIPGTEKRPKQKKCKKEGDQTQFF
jgi:hypothetical protein